MSRFLLWVINGHTGASHRPVEGCSSGEPAQPVRVPPAVDRPLSRSGKDERSVLPALDLTLPLALAERNAPECLERCSEVGKPNYPSRFLPHSSSERAPAPPVGPTLPSCTICLVPGWSPVNLPSYSWEPWRAGVWFSRKMNLNSSLWAPLLLSPSSPLQDQFICQSSLQVELRPSWRPAHACQLL